MSLPLNSTPGPRAGSRALRTAAAAVFFLIFFLAVGWSGYWYIAQQIALREFHLQLEREARYGRVWSCDSVKSGGYPLAVSLDCAAPKLRIEEGLGSQTWSAARAVIQAQLYTPNLVEIDLTGPGELVTDSAATSLKWSTLQISTRGLPQRLDRLSIIGRDLAAILPDRTPATAEALHFHLKRTAVGPMAPYSLTAGLAGLDSPLLSQAAGGGALFTLIGIVTQLDAAGIGQWADRLDAWRMAGGRLSISAISLTRGDFAVQGEGAAGLDQLHRIDGRIAVRLRNAGPLLLTMAERAGKLQRNTLAGQLTAGLLGRPGELKFDVAAENGALSVGPLRRLLQLPPLY